MSTAQATLPFTGAHAAKKPAVFPLAAFYGHLQAHDWYYFFSEDRQTLRAGEIAEKHLKKVASESGPVHEWLFGEFSKHKGTGSAWNTPQHPLPPAPVELKNTDVINIRVEMAKAELVAAALRLIKPFVPAFLIQFDPVWPVMQKVLYLGAYAGDSPAPALIAAHPKLLCAWEQGQQLVAENEHPTV